MKDTRWSDCSLMRFLKIAIAPTVFVGLLSGCAPGHRLSQGQFAFRHPAVKWVFHVRDRLAWRQYLYLPGAATLKSMRTSISGESVDHSSVSFWAIPSLGTCSDTPFESSEFVRLDLETGDLLKPVGSPRRAGGRPIESWTNQAAFPVIYSEGSDTYLGWRDRDGREAIRILGLRWGSHLGTGGRIPSAHRESDSRAVFVTSANYVICVDMEALESAP